MAESDDSSRRAEPYARSLETSHFEKQSGGKMTEPITVLIVDDHQVVRQGVRTFLETQPDIAVVAEAESGQVAIQLAAEHAPDVVLMDLLMPGIDGIAATREVKRVSPRTQVIVLTSYHQSEHIFPAIRAGALSYLLKDASPQELVEAVRKAARGEVILHPRVAARVMQELHGAGQDTLDPLTSLSDRELEVLRLIADGLTNAEIAERLVIGEKTVKSHVSNILGKLHLADRTQAAVFAWREGFVRRSEV
jgi:NarL family two-component system response regulator LiaR